MAKVRYISTPDPTDDDVCTVFGTTFQKGKATTVSDDLAQRLSGNPTFEIVSGNVSADPDPAPADQGEPAAPDASNAQG